MVDQAFQQLQQICAKRLDWLVENKKLYDYLDVYIERLNNELGVFASSGYASVILIISDYIKWARENNVVVGPGRGSAAGSLVVYLCEITSVDPIRHGLIFERFLNPERVSLPDIDSDFSDRDKVIDYLKSKYGINRVARVGVPSLFKPRSAIDEFARVLGIPFEEAKRINKLVTEKTIEESVTANPQLQEYIDKYPTLFELAKRSVKYIHHITTHPSAVILANGPIGRQIPLVRSRGDSEELVTAWDGEELDALGYVKLDILTVDNLDIINRTLQMLPEDIRRSIDIYDLPLDDWQTLRGFEEGDTVGVFQLEEPKSVGILRALKNIKFEDVYAVNALIRPGLDISAFIKNRDNPDQIEYLIPELKPILAPTYGVILYQEQVMKICTDLANFSMAEADKVRKIIAKTANQRAADGLNPIYEKFKAGYLANGLPEDRLDKIWEKILATQNYVFNKAHATVYGLIAYIDMYLKKHYPLQFMCAALQCKHRELFVKECNRLNIKVLPPDINLSDANYKIEGAAIRVGLGNVKHVGNTGGLISGRPYDNIDKIKRSKIKKNIVEYLAYAGAFDSFGDRDYVIEELVGTKMGFTDLSVSEKDALGYNLKYNLLDEFAEVLGGCIQPGRSPATGQIGGMVLRVKGHQAKTGPMAFLTILTLNGEIDALIWPSDYAKYASVVQYGNVIIARGKRTDRSNSYALDNISLLREAVR